MNPQTNDGIGVFLMVIGAAVGCAVLARFFYGVRHRKTLHPREHGRQSLLTIFPLGLQVDGIRMSGPVNRLSLYEDLLVIRYMGRTRILSPEDLAAARISGPWVVIVVWNANREETILVATDANGMLLEQIERWRSREL
jgi:Na+-transporting NADH:ubiquinone oxidoreductase subunit NqrB